MGLFRPSLGHLTSLYLEFAFIDIGPLSSLTSLTDLLLNGRGDGTLRDIGPLSGLTSLETLDLSFNFITDISALSGLTSLRYLNLRPMFVALNSIQPLLDNPGLGEGDVVRLPAQPTGAAGNVTCADVAKLQAKGVTVVSDCPDDP